MFAMTASAERIMAAEAFADDRDAAVVPDEEVRRFYREDFRALGLRDVGFAYAAVDSVVEQDAAAEAGGRGRAHGASGDAGPAAESAVACAGTPAGRRVLSRFSLELAKGDCMALMGPSGRGKSTVIKLLMRLYAPDEGCCYLRGSQGEQELTASWRGLFAYVPQGSQLMSGTIRSCVAFGDARLMHDDEAIMQALDVACAGSFVRELPDGIDAELGERGSGLSEGQLQRIAIARAVFSGHPVLLLDESTSSLDADTERELLGNLQRMTDRTVLLVTHRESVLAICNKRITLDELR